MSSISPIKLNIAEKLEKDKDYRSRFFRGQAQDRIAMSIRILRKKRKKTQTDLAEESNMLQSAISRIEQANYSGWSLKVLFRVADALDARLRVSFEPVEDVIDWYRDKEAIAVADTKDANKFMERQPSNVFEKVVNIEKISSTTNKSYASIMEDKAIVTPIRTIAVASA